MAAGPLPYGQIVEGALDIAGEATGAIGGVVSAYADQDVAHRNYEKLKRLQNLEDMDLLGLTEQEKQALYQRMGSQAEAVGRSGRQAQDRALASYVGSGAGALLPFAAAQEAQAAKLQTAMGSTISEADRVRAMAQEQEIEDRLAYDVAQKQAKIAAVTNLLTAGLASASDMVGTSAKLGAYDEAPIDQMDPDAIKDLMEADEVYQSMYDLGVN